MVKVQPLGRALLGLWPGHLGSCEWVRPVLVAGPGVSLGQAGRTRHTRACTHRVHGHVPAAGSAQAGSLKARGRGREPGRRGRRGEREQRTRRGGGGRAGPRLAAVRWGRPGRAVIGRGLRGPLAAETRAPNCGPGPPAPRHLRRGRGAGEGRVPAHPPGWSSEESRNVCAHPHPHHTQRPTGRGVPGDPGRAGRSGPTPRGDSQRAGSAAQRAGVPKWKRARAQEAVPSERLAGACVCTGREVRGHSREDGLGKKRVVAANCRMAQRRGVWMT